MPFQKIKNAVTRIQAGFCPARLAGWAHDEPELGQPLMVVVLVVIARAALSARAAEAMIKETGCAANMARF
jgi:hypothetical protein